MTTALLTYALFFLPLFFIGAFLLTGLPVAVSLQNYYQNRGRQSVTCPDSRQLAAVEVEPQEAEVARRGPQGAGARIVSEGLSEEGT